MTGMALIKGIPVVLITKSETGRDAFNRPITEETRETVENVLVAPLSQTDTDVIGELSLDGKHARYQLGIPKGDDHQWENAVVEFFGQRWRASGFVTEGIDALIPLDWNRKVVVERYG